MAHLDETPTCNIGGQEHSEVSDIPFADRCHVHVPRRETVFMHLLCGKDLTGILLDLTEILLDLTEILLDLTKILLDMIEIRLDCVHTNYLTV